MEPRPFGTCVPFFAVIVFPIMVVFFALFSTLSLLAGILCSVPLSCGCCCLYSWRCSKSWQTDLYQKIVYLSYYTVNRGIPRPRGIPEFMPVKDLIPKKKLESLDRKLLLCAAPKEIHGAKYRVQIECKSPRDPKALNAFFGASFVSFDTLLSLSSVKAALRKQYLSFGLNIQVPKGGEDQFLTTLGTKVLQRILFLIHASPPPCLSMLHIHAVPSFIRLFLDFFGLPL